MDTPAPSSQGKPVVPAGPRVSGGGPVGKRSLPADGPIGAVVLASAEGAAPAGEVIVGEEEQQPHHAPGFFNQPWVQNILPLATSLFLHIGIIVVGVALYTAVQQVVERNKEQVIIPQTASLAKSATPGGVKHPGPPADPTRDVAQNSTKDTDDKGFSDTVGNKLASAGGPSDAAASFGLGANTAGGHGKTFGRGEGGGGTAPWGMPGGGEGMLPKSDFMGTGGNANDIVFLCDASGSMVSVFGALKQELKRAISEMAVDENGAQKFNVIFFQDDKSMPLFSGGMQLATPDNKQKANDFIDNQFSVGGTQPIPAIKMALAEKPQLLYVLTDGFDQIADMSLVTNEFKKGEAAANGNIHINCIFLQSDEDPKLVAALKEISDIGHGNFVQKLKKDM